MYKWYVELFKLMKINVTDAALAGADIATIPYKVILQMIKHPLTDAGIERFLKDWEGLK